MRAGICPDSSLRRCDMPSAAFGKTVASIFDAVLDDRQTPAVLEAVAKFVGLSGVGCVMANKFTGQISSAVWWEVLRVGPQTT
jgi:hypothetical protein